MTYHTSFGCSGRVNTRVLKFVIILSLFSALLTIYRAGKYFGKKDVDVILQHKEIVERFYKGHENLNTSKLGGVLFKNEHHPEVPEEKRNKVFIIWKAKHKSGNELNGCSVNNCIFTGDDNKLQSADAVIVRIQLGKIPSLERRNPNQRWLFLNDESPHHAFSLAKGNTNVSKRLSELHNVFNWSLTYRSDADVPVPYGRTVALETPRFLSSDPPIKDLVPEWKDKKRDVLVAILISNCGVSYRMNVIETLKKFIKVDVHGKCGKDDFKKSCPGHFKVDCKLMSQYLFYLVLENSKCKEYMTEKLFYNAYLKGAIPIIQGPSVEECQKFLPPNSYLHLDNYTTIKELAEDILRISTDEKELLYYHQWRNHFEVVNEHGYFGVKPLRLCRVCEAMNYNDDEESVYSEQKLREFLDPAPLCRN